jgi:hypothetical protein
VAIETARQLSAPDSPSRLECVFTCETIADAIAFRDRFRKDSAVYEVECDDGASRHVGNSYTDAGKESWPDLDPAAAQAVLFELCGSNDNAR